MRCCSRSSVISVLPRTMSDDVQVPFSSALLVRATSVFISSYLFFLLRVSHINLTTYRLRSSLTDDHVAPQ